RPYTPSKNNSKLPIFTPQIISPKGQVSSEQYNELFTHYENLFTLYENSLADCENLENEIKLKDEEIKDLRKKVLELQLLGNKLKNEIDKLDPLKSKDNTESKSTKPDEDEAYNNLLQTNK